MKSVAAIYTSPVKSLGLVQSQEVHVASSGIVEDRRLYLIDQQNRLLTQRQAGRLVQVQAEYSADPEWLRLRFPDGTMLEDPWEPGEAVTTQMWGRSVPGHLATGDWDQALSSFCQQSVRLAKSDQPGACYDEYPISLVSQASVQGLSQRVPPPLELDSRRFRPNFLLAGCQPHEEDDWLGGLVQIGEELVLRVVARDPRCIITTHDPTTGEADLDTLGLILSYRPSPQAPYFGVYGMVEHPGKVSVGDSVQPVAGASGG
ncbi:MAG: MOSC domain-containing protein [Dehalococcoidia bacterium]